MRIYSGMTTISGGNTTFFINNFNLRMENGNIVFSYLVIHQRFLNIETIRFFPWINSQVRIKQYKEKPL